MHAEGTQETVGVHAEGFNLRQSIASLSVKLFHQAETADISEKNA